MAFTVEVSSELQNAVSQVPVMLEQLESRQRDFLSRQSGNRYVTSTVVGDVRLLVQFPLEDLVAAESEPLDAPPENYPESEDVTSTYANDPYGRRPAVLRAWVRASSNTRRLSKGGMRSPSKAMARYRDSLADAAMAEWNVLVRRWAGAYEPVQARRAAVTTAPETVPITLNL